MNSKKKHRQVQRDQVGIKNVNVRENEWNERNIDKREYKKKFAWFACVCLGALPKQRKRIDSVEVDSRKTKENENDKKKAKLMSPPHDGKNVVFWLLELVAQCGGTCCQY